MNVKLLDTTNHTLPVQAIVLRDLRTSLELSEKYADWHTRQLDMFTQGIDFVRIQVYLNPTNNMPMDDVAVTLEMAKHICLMSRTEKGKEYRRKLIALENKPMTQLN